MQCQTDGGDEQGGIICPVCNMSGGIVVLRFGALYVLCQRVKSVVRGEEGIGEFFVEFHDTSETRGGVFVRGFCRTPIRCQVLEELIESFVGRHYWSCDTICTKLTDEDRRKTSVTEKVRRGNRLVAFDDQNEPVSVSLALLTRDDSSNEQRHSLPRRPLSLLDSAIRRPGGEVLLSKYLLCSLHRPSVTTGLSMGSCSEPSSLIMRLLAWKSG